MILSGPAANLRGSVLMVAAMGCFAIEDALLKTVARDLPVGQILILFGLGGMLGFAGLSRWRDGSVLHRAMLSRTLLLRAGFEVTGRLFYTLAIALTPLSSASAILQATPLVVVAGAAVVFGERVGWQRWAVILTGFAGVMIILRPGTESFTPLSLLAVLGTIGFAGRDLATRAAPAILTNFQLGFCGFAMLLPAGALLLAFSGGSVRPASGDAGLLLLATLVGVVAYAALTGAMRTGDVAVVTPFRYSRLLFALILGIVVFAERPEATTLLGSAIVVGTGVWTIIRANQARRVSIRQENVA